MKKIILYRALVPIFCLSGTIPTYAQSQTNDYANDYCYANDPCIPNCCEENYWNFAADFLYWSTNFNALSAIGVELETTDTTADASIQIKHPNQQWDPGVRLTAGWACSNNWDFSGSWTYFYNSTTRHTAPFQLQVNMDSLDTSGSSRHVFRYNAADLKLATTWLSNPCVLIRPFIGVNAIWLDIDSRLNIAAPPSSGPDITTDGFTVGINLNKRSWGVGPKVGVNTFWGNFKGCSLVANINGSLLYGEQRAKINAEVDITSSVDINILLMGDSYWQLMSTIQMQSGFSYLGCLCNHEFRVNALWECNMINHANNILIFDRSISIQGLTLSLEYPF